jgi:hypothetical protein
MRPSARMYTASLRRSEIVNACMYVWTHVLYNDCSLRACGMCVPATVHGHPGKTESFHDIMMSSFKMCFYVNNRVLSCNDCYMQALNATQ